MNEARAGTCELGRSRRRRAKEGSDRRWMTSGSDNLLYVQEEASGGSCGCYCGDGGKSCGGGVEKLKWGPGDGG